MKITIAAIGKQRRDATTEILAEYEKRLSGAVQILEADSKAGSKPNPKDIEADQLLSMIPKGAFIIALDEHGHNLTSPQFAEKIQSWQNAGENHFCFVIGGADGLGDAVLKAARFKLALGQMTWPHRMVKVMILEQIYRAKTILDGHPYHRE